MSADDRIDSTEPLTPEEDTELRNKITASFDRVTLDESAKNAMLDALKNAEAFRSNASETQQEPLRAAASRNPHDASKRRPRLIRFALPIAACLIVAAIGFSAIYNYNMAPSSAEEAASPAPKSNSAEIASDSATESEAESTLDSSELDDSPTDHSPSLGLQDGNGTVTSEESVAANAATSYDRYRDYPIIELSDGRRLAIVEGEAPETDTALLQEARALSPDESREIRCWVFEANDGSFAVTYDRETYHLAL